MSERQILEIGFAFAKQKIAPYSDYMNMPVRHRKVLIELLNEHNRKEKAEYDKIRSKGKKR